MSIPLKPVNIGEVSYNVALLQECLGVLGFPVAQSEIDSTTAGPNTVQQTRAVQKQLGVRIDESTLLNDGTITAINKALDSSGLTATTRAFIVEGRVTLPAGSPARRQILLAFDVDLRGAGTYRTAKSLPDIQKNGGFDFLGQTTTDVSGNYNFTFYDWQYQRAERNLADVVVFAIQKTGQLVIGTSRLVNSQDYSDKGIVLNLDFVINPVETRTEYEALMAALTPFLNESGVTLRQIAPSADQLSFTASELDLDETQINVAASAALLVQPDWRAEAHPVLYALGRSNVTLSWSVLYQKKEEELLAVVKSAITTHMIPAISDEVIGVVLGALHTAAAQQTLAASGDKPNSLKSMLTNARFNDAQQQAFALQLARYAGADYQNFWTKVLPSDPAFKDNPALISSLLLTQQLTVLSGNHQALVKELQITRNVASLEQLIDFTPNDWLSAVKNAGVPDFISGDTIEERQLTYATLLDSVISSTFSTLRIGRMVDANQLPIEKVSTVKNITSFLATNPTFSFATSRVSDFEPGIKAAGGDDADALRNELNRIQRVFQISPSPDAMPVLMNNNLNSARGVATIPQQTFIEMYSSSLGGAEAAYATYQRAAYIADRNEMAAMNLMDYTFSALPISVLGPSQAGQAKQTIIKHLPNYSELFGSPDLCDCKECRSVYSAAAYLVDLLRFLWRSKPTAGNSPLEILGFRRPDILNLPLTCENTNTIIPYIDLGNEVMEAYVASGSLAHYIGDTGDATADELRANPQNVNTAAYRTIKDAKYPFNLPYHQPLDAIRLYSDNLKISRYEAMKALNETDAMKAVGNIDATAANAIAAERLRLSQEDYLILTGFNFAGNPANPAIETFACYGYSSSADLEKLRKVPEFLQRSGLLYTDLVDLITTTFLNPNQQIFDILQTLLSFATFYGTVAYSKITKIAMDPNPVLDSDTIKMLDSYSATQKTPWSQADFIAWVKQQYAGLIGVVTLYQAQSECDLATTELRTIRSIYEGQVTSGLTTAFWSKCHRFIRLWRRLGWTIHETDVILTALGESDITPQTMLKLEKVLCLQAETKLTPSDVAVFWGAIDTYGPASVYKKLFLNKAVQQLDSAFRPDAKGRYLQGTTALLSDHLPAILAAFRIRQDDLDAIAAVAVVSQGNQQRALDLDTDKLTLEILSVIYRHVLLARALRLPVIDFCTLLSLFKKSIFADSPFSVWDITNFKFTQIDPVTTHAFYAAAASVKTHGFTATTLNYALVGNLPPNSPIGLKLDAALLATKGIRDALAAIDLNLPGDPPSPLTPEALAARLALTYQPDIVAQFMAIVTGTATFSASATKNLNITIPLELSSKYTYTKGTGLLTCVGVVTDDDKTALTNLNAGLAQAASDLYKAPETFIAENFAGIFQNLPDAYRKLLDHPAQHPLVSLQDGLKYVYSQLVPVLRVQLRRNAVSQQISTLIGLGADLTVPLISADIDALLTSLATAGFSGTYFANAGWTAPSASQAIEEELDFEDWGTNAPNASVPADNFSVRWEAYVAAPNSGDYIFMVDVDGADEIFRLYLDNNLALEKKSGDATVSMETPSISLNAAKLIRLRLEYADITGAASVQLRWRQATTAPEDVPAASAFPASIVDSFVAQAAKYHRAAQIISGFSLTATELQQFIAHPADFGNLNFAALKAQDWMRLRDFVDLRNSIPQAQALLTDIFDKAIAADPHAAFPANPDQLLTLIGLATGWNADDVAFLVGQFKFAASAFANEIALNSIRSVLRICASTGLAVDVVAVWGTVTTDFDTLNDFAQQLKNGIKAKYSDADWLTLSGSLSDKLRRNQQQALVSYLLTVKSIQDAGVTSADGLFELFLIDVQMGACMDTSRIVQANSSIQMFVNRCLLNLEPDVSPDAIDTNRWAWMQNYRVWEANRMVFLYPENWLDPEFRTDKSEFFTDLESYLVQNDITTDSVEQAFRNYITSLSEVANLEVCGMHRENDDQSNLAFLHVFARTHNAPYKYFYRHWNQAGVWSPWEKVPVDIRSVDDGDKSGVHLLPVVWKKRLILFWPEFIEKKGSPNSGSNISPYDHLSKPLSASEATKYWEVHLAWSEYGSGKWSPKQLSKEFFSLDIADPTADQSTVLFSHRIDVNGINIAAAYRQRETSNYASYAFTLRDLGSFALPDIAAKVDEEPGAETFLTEEWPQYTIFFQKHIWDSQNYPNATSMMLLGIPRLRDVDSDQQLVFDSTLDLPLQKLDSPFFFSNHYRTYFVQPRSIPIYATLTSPEKQPPFLWKPEDPPVASAGPGITGGGPREMVVERAIRSAGPAPAERLVLAPRTNTSASSSSQFSGSSNYISGSFVGSLRSDYVGWSHQIIVGYAKKLEFDTFYHPFSSTFVSNLNHYGIPDLLNSDTSIPSDGGASFGKYNPDPKYVYIPDGAELNRHTYYQENVCFDPLGANSSYNWELFFHAPLYIATRLSKNGQYEEAMHWFHYIFDPTTNDSTQDVSRYWKVLPFKTTPSQRLEDFFLSLQPDTNPSGEDPHSLITQWRNDPFDPFLIANNRPLAYMKNVVMKYVENLLNWGDSLFRQNTMESVNDALQIYVMANHILGPRPQFVPKRGDVTAATYNSLVSKWDNFSNALVQLENLFPYSSSATASSSNTGGSLIGVGRTLYFCIPSNDQLLSYWDTAADRLFKIRHCQNIDGIERKLALFSPPIDPGALIRAASQGLSLSSILADLSSPPPLYRFAYLLQRANEFCADLRALGGSLLAALEKRDAEELSRLRASQETQMLQLMTDIKVRQLLDAQVNREHLAKAREAAQFRLQHYLDLLGDDSVTVPASPTISVDLTADSSLPADTVIPEVQPGADVSLVASGEAGIKVIPREKSEIDNLNTSRVFQAISQAHEGIAAILHAIPQFGAATKPYGIGAELTWGGTNLGNMVSAGGHVFNFIAGFYSHDAVMASKMAGYIRRQQDWAFQANLAEKEIIQLDKQITSADIRIQTAQKELDNHTQQITNAQAVETFLRNKFSSQELYQWMKEQSFAVYKQAYNLAFDMARKAERAHNFELGIDGANIVQYGYWDDSKQGLAAGEKLQLALRQLEQAHCDQNFRELELTKSISLARLDPLALITLRETGRCQVSLPEELFDLDFRGHYFRRIKSARLTIPCVVGPYTALSCSLHLLNNRIRINTDLSGGGQYEPDDDDWINDSRFYSNHVPVTAVATSSGQNDAGMFEFSFRDERYLPFEGAGAISTWSIELSTEKSLRQFDYSTISDVIVHLSFTAREDSGLKDAASTYMVDRFLPNFNDLPNQPLVQLFSMKRDFPSEWNKFLRPPAAGTEQILNFKVGKDRLPYFVQLWDEVILEIIQVFIRSSASQPSYEIKFSYTDDAGMQAKPIVPDQSTKQDMITNADVFGDLTFTSIGQDGHVDLERASIDGPFSIGIRNKKTAGDGDYTKLATNPDELTDMFVVLHFKLASPRA